MYPNISTVDSEQVNAWWVDRLQQNVESCCSCITRAVLKYFTKLSKKIPIAGSSFDKVAELEPITFHKWTPTRLFPEEHF